MKKLFVCMVCLVHVCLVQAQRNTYYDGPYISTNQDKARIAWIAAGEKHDTIVHIADFPVFDREGLPVVRLDDLQFERDNFARYDSVSRFVAISDVHGQYDLFVDLLQGHGVVDQAGDWMYGDGHLVIVGDIFDRGNKVTEILWFLFRLEKEAARAGGKVHVLLGNHEMMVLHGDLRYIHPKYRFTTGSLKIPYPRLYDELTVLGAWLRTKNVATVINGIGFVHGGFSKRVIDKESSIQVLNDRFKTDILNTGDEPSSRDALLSLLYFENGPLWYRGYADPSGFDEEQANIILEALDLDAIVVGHTSMPRIVSLHSGKILLIDSSIKFGKTGEVLVYENNEMYRGLLDGSLISLDASSVDRSPFEYVYDFEEAELTIVLDTDLDELFKNKLDEKWQYSRLLARHDNELNRAWEVRIRARGNMRKRTCHLPPLKIDFPKKTLDYLGFTKHDKLKVVLPCDKGSRYQQGLYREYIVYKLYQVIDSLSFRTRLVNFGLVDEGKMKYDVTGFVIESDEDYADRNKCIIITNGIVNSESVDRQSYLRMNLFQYMITNNDYAIYNKHNIKLIKHPDVKFPLAIPYDFDYAGIVDQDYARPSSNLPIHSVREPYFRGKDVTYEEIKQTSNYFLSKEKELFEVIENADYLNKSNKKFMKKDLQRFFGLLKDESRWRVFLKEDD